MNYNELMKNRYDKYAQSGDYTFDQPQVQEEAAPQAQAPATATEKGMAGAASAVSKGGGGMDVISQGLMASGNPYAMAAGLGLSAANSIVKGRNERAQQRYQAELEKINQRQQAISKMAQIGQGLRA